MVDMSKVVGANISGIEDKILGYMVMFSVPEDTLVPTDEFLTILKEYDYERFVEIPTPQKAFKRAVKVFKNMTEKTEVNMYGKKVVIEANYDTIQAGEIEYLVRKFRVISSSKKKKSAKDKIDMERIAILSMDGTNVTVKPITRHIGSTKIVINDDMVKKIQDFLQKEVDKHLHNYSSNIIRAFIRDKILRGMCRSIPFVGHGGAWFIINNEETTLHISNLKEILNSINTTLTNNGIKPIRMIVIPMFDSEDVRAKIQEDIGREVTARYKKLLKSILMKMMYAKSGDKIDELLTELINSEDAIKEMIKEYADVIKGSIKVEIENLKDIKNQIINVVESKSGSIDVDKDKIKLLISTVGNFRDDSKGIEVYEEETEEEKEQGLSLLDIEKMDIIKRDLAIDKYTSGE